MSLLNITQRDYSFLGANIHQPTINELTDLFKNENELIFILKLLVGSLKETLQVKDEHITEFQVFLSLLIMDTDSFGLTVERKKKFLDFLSLCFKGYTLSIAKESFIFKKDETSFLVIDNSNFDDFKKILSRMFDIPEIFGAQEEAYKPKDARAARIAKMLEKDNKKRAEMNGPKSKKGVIENYIEVLATGMKIPPPVLTEKLTLYNLFNWHKRFFMKTSWDLDIDCRLAGGSPKESPDNWMSLI